MSEVVTEILTYLADLEQRYHDEALRDDLTHDVRSLYRERAIVLHEVRDELRRRYAP